MVDNPCVDFNGFSVQKRHANEFKRTDFFLVDLRRIVITM